jgi:hypothetical protein
MLRRQLQRMATSAISGGKWLSRLPNESWPTFNFSDSNRRSHHFNLKLKERGCTWQSVANVICESAIFRNNILLAHFDIIKMDKENWDVLEDFENDWHESEIRSLIAYIKSNKFLVDKTEKDFSNKNKKDQTWKVIAMLLNKTGMFHYFMYCICVKFEISFNSST